MPEGAIRSDRGRRRLSGRGLGFGGIAANGLNRLGTLTYAPPGCHEPRRLRADLAGFFRSLRRRLGGQALAYVWVPEWHKTGHGWHAHFAVARYVKRSLIEEAWGRGFVSIKLLSGLPVGSGAQDEARLAARYLAKHLGKDADGDCGRGLNRYEVAQGFQPEAELVTGRTVWEALARASARMGSEPLWVWQSREKKGWQGPAGGEGGMALDREQVAAWVERSCAEQGMPVRVSDPRAIDHVVVLLVGRAGPRQRAAAREQASPPVTDATRA